MDERRLRKFFHFTEDDLLANRRGEFSKTQKKRIDKEAEAERRSARDSAVILSVIAAAGMTVGITIGSIAPSGIGRILVLLMMGVVWPSAWGWKAVQFIRDAKRLQDPHLRSVSGSVHITRYEDEYILQIGGLEFDLDGNPFGTLLEGDEVSVYYVEATQEILSVEGSIDGTK